mgnify:CR=1 FL=1
MNYLKYLFNDDISEWNISKVIDMTDLFYYTELFNQPIYKWYFNKKIINKCNNIFYYNINFYNFNNYTKLLEYYPHLNSNI